MKIYTFIDTQNLVKTIQGKNLELDFEKLFVYLSEELKNDGDFYNLIKYIKDKNKFKNIVSPSRENCSKLLRKIANNKIIFLDDIYHIVCRDSEIQSTSL